MPRHEVDCTLAYGPEPLFDLAADVERYPEFVPGWVAARVRKRADNLYGTDQIVGFGPIRQQFSSTTTLRRPERIDVTSNDRAFKHFHMTWLFKPLDGGNCRVTLIVEIDFRSPIVDALFRQAIGHMTGAIVTAFEARARQLQTSSDRKGPGE